MTLNEPKPSILVIGGGAAGMIAAWRAGSLGAKVVLFEKNPKLGIKLLISGGGKCNITHGGDMENLRLQFRTNEARFLKHSFFQFTNADIVAELHKRGVSTYERENGRVFPVNHNAGDVVRALHRMIESVGSEIRLDSSVEEILKDEMGICGIRVRGQKIECRKVILATGGSSFVKTGTTGDGFIWAQKLGHTLVPIRPALAPLYLSPTPPTHWQGIAVRDCLLSAKNDRTVVAQWKGDVLFTHLGISGPAALEVSRDIVVALERKRRIAMMIDCAPSKTEKQLEQELLDISASSGSKAVRSLVELYLPQRLAPFLLLQVKINESKKLHQLRRNERSALIYAIKNWHIGEVKEIPIDRGEVTAGGIDLHEVDPRSMRSRVVKGLYACGEVLDIAGPIGGYNLQAAFSTGYVAGESAATNVIEGG